MKQQRPIGITIYVLIGILYGICFLFLSIVYFIFRTSFALFEETSTYLYYIASFICFVVGACFFTSSLALFFQRKLWARTLFLWAVVMGMSVEIWLFVRDIIRNTRLEVSLIDLQSTLELMVVLTLSLIAFWYFNRKNVREYLSSKEQVND